MTVDSQSMQSCTARTTVCAVDFHLRTLALMCFCAHHRFSADDTNAIRKRVRLRRRLSEGRGERVARSETVRGVRGARRAIRRGVIANGSGTETGAGPERE